MKTIILSLAFISLVVPQKTAVQKNPQVLFDFRVGDNTESREISEATERMVLSKVFRKYLTDANRCKSQLDTSDATDYLAAARKVGQIVPTIADSETGSFTAPGQVQTLYLIDVSECNASHADNFGTKRVVIFSGQQLVADSDGVNELLMTTADMAQGTLIEMGTMVSFQNGKRNLIQDFGTVVEDSCASGFPGSTSNASVLYISDVVPGTMPKLGQENYRSSCGKTKRWRLVSRGKKEN